MAENNENKYIIKVKGKEVEVSEEVYRAYIRPIRAEQRRKRREWKCSKLSKTGGYYVRCNERCETCPYYQSGNITSNALSSNVGQFGCGATDTSNKKILDFYVYGESGAPSLDYETADANNLCSGNVYYYSETEKSGCWHYVNGVATLWN